MDMQKSKQEKVAFLWRKYGPAIKRSLCSYEADPELRQDLAQNVFLALLSSLDYLLKADNERAYLFRIVHNVATDHIVRESRRQWEDGVEDCADQGANPEQEAKRDGRREQIYRAVRKLSLPYRQVILLVLEDFTYTEIAQTLGLSEVNVRVRVSRAKEKLKEVLNRE